MSRHRVRQIIKHISSDAGMATAEYVIVTLAAVGFAGLLAVVLTSGQVRQLITDAITKALT